MKKCAVTSNKVPLSKPKPWTRSPSVLTRKSSKDDTAARLPQPLDRSRWTGCSEQWTYGHHYRDTRHRRRAAFCFARHWTQVIIHNVIPDLRSRFCIFIIILIVFRDAINSIFILPSAFEGTFRRFATRDLFDINLNMNFEYFWKRVNYTILPR